MMSVLYVDDEMDLLKIGKFFFEHSGNITVTTASGATEAIELLTHQSFDVIISDSRKQKMDEIAFLKHLNAEKETNPFILFSGKEREEVVIEALNNGIFINCMKTPNSKIITPGQDIPPITPVITVLPERANLNEISGCFGIYRSPVEFFHRNDTKNRARCNTGYIKKEVPASWKMGQISQKNVPGHRAKKYGDNSRKPPPEKILIRV